jgi:hypothetical protein
MRSKRGLPGGVHRRRLNLSPLKARSTQGVRRAMRDLMRGRLFTEHEQEKILDYCHGDVEDLL